MSSSKVTPLPAFLIIGAGKSGTTSLESYLKQHPRIFLPEVKEPNFFAYEMHKEEDFEDHSTKEHYRHSVTTFHDYTKLFEQADQNQIIGEISNTYLYMPQALERIKHHVPNAKIIAIIRQPAERLFSRYNHLLRVDKVPSDSFEDIFDRASIWWKRPDLIQEGFYGKHLNKYFKNFDNQQLKIFFFDDLKKNAEVLLAEMLNFLDIDPDFKFQTAVRFNKSGRIKSKLVDRAIGNDNIIMSKLSHVTPYLYQMVKKNMVLRRLVEYFRSKNLESARLDPVLRQRITDEIYKEDIQLLESLLTTRLSHWY